MPISRPMVSACPIRVWPAILRKHLIRQRCCARRGPTWRRTPTKHPCLPTTCIRPRVCIRSSPRYVEQQIANSGAGALTGRRTRPGSASVRISKQSFCSSGSVPIAQKAAQRTARRAKDRDAIEHHCGPRGGCAGGCSVPARSCSSGGVGSAQNGSSGVNVK